MDDARVADDVGVVADPYLLTEGEGRRLLATHPWRRFAVLGDSIAEGVGEALPGYPDRPWTDLIADELAAHRPELARLNLGCSDTQAAQVRATQLSAALAWRPDLALVACGGYDVLLPAFDAVGVEAELHAMVAALRGAGCDVITVSMFDGSHSPLVPAQYRAGLRRRLHALSDLTRRVAASLDTLHVDLLEHPAARENIYSSDGRHGNRRGHAIAAAETVRRLGAHLASAAPAVISHISPPASGPLD